MSTEPDQSHVAANRPFLGLTTRQARVLAIAAEDPPEYTAWLNRRLDVPRDMMTFYRAPIQLDPEGLHAIAHTVEVGRYGLVLIASWQAVVSSLVRDENDNAGAVRILENVKRVARATRISWLIDAHSGKGEDQSDEADPNHAMRGASGAAGSADYTLSLRYGNGPFGTRRRLSGKGRFVSCKPMLLEFDPATDAYTVVDHAPKTAVAETTWRVIYESGAISATPKSIDAIARDSGLVKPRTKVTGTHRRSVRAALERREGVRMMKEMRRGQETTLYALVEQP
jgi:hypothetical protein